MLSAVFVDRPRLAIVIAIIITIAGAISLRASRWRSSPTSCRRRCRSATRYPGASAAVVEATVAQPLEAQINGVDQMIYMKSNSAQRRQLQR